MTEYLWCFDHGQNTVGFGGVRRSFLLGAIMKLGEVYPQATAALEQRRDATEARIVPGSESFEDVADVLALNRVLKTGARSLAVYDRLRKAKPISAQLRGSFSRELLEPLVADRRYTDAVELFDDPAGYVTARMKLYDDFAAKVKPTATDEETSVIHDPNGPNPEVHILPTKPKRRDPSDTPWRQSAVVECSRMYEALVGGGRKDVAASTADALIKFAATGGTYAALITSAARAGDKELAKLLAERGLGSLPEEEKAEARWALQKSVPDSK